MKPFSILLIRLLGLYLFLKTLFSVLPALISPMGSSYWSAEVFPMLMATVAVPMVGGVLLWCFAGRLAGRLHGDSDAGVDATDVDLVRAGTFLIGVYLLVRYVSMLVGVYVSSGDLAYDALVAVAAGIGMMLGGSYLVALYCRVKYFGADR
ncbi:hypothetical protein [Franzmannia qiaohouensis]|uniref:Transmembrane protein n=1 Tax=Franzmannia qiaohouensis TaxID=1329370 RepID=A0ABU1HJP2_9GAMM|nr:hypothetical protein [Halomonas qiaohouensis]MDR5906989.1 hypothetical protein [Halomonas qiaohouensis]